MFSEFPSKDNEIRELQNLVLIQTVVIGLLVLVIVFMIIGK